jgi:SAM-dependent methyltransferase
VVASLSLHHIENLGGILDKLAEVLRTGGSLVVVEFGWDRIDEATAEWALERLLDASLSEKHSWLGRRCQGWVRGGQGGNRARRAESYFAEWAGEEGLHSSLLMLDELGRRFVERFFEWVPYLYPDLGEDTVEADESAAIEARVINATGFRYIGATTPETGRSRAARRG